MAKKAQSIMGVDRSEVLTKDLQAHDFGFEDGIDGR